MSTPKKSLLACVSAAALVASIGFVQAQSPDASTNPAPADSTMSPAAEGVAPTPAPAPDPGNLTVTDAPETRVDLSPPSEPLYNLPSSGERAPKPDRN